MLFYLVKIAEIVYGASSGTRTLNPLIKNQVLLPIELKTQIKTLLPRLWPYIVFGQGNSNLGFAYHVAPLITTECFSITFNAFFCRASKAGTLSFRTMSYGCERLGSNQRFPPYEGGEMTTSLLRNIVERIQLTYSTSRLFYQPNHIKLCCCYQQYLSRRNYSHIGF